MTDEPVVVVLHGSDEAYGADRILLRAVVGLRDRGRQPHVLLPDDVPPGWLSAQLQLAGIPTERVALAPARRRYLGPRHLPAYVVALVRARRLIRQRATALGARLIHVNTSALLVGGILGRPGGARVLWHVHEIVVRPALAAWIFRLVPGLSGDRVIAVSDAVRRNLTPRGLFRARIVTLRNGIDDRRPAPLPSLTGGGPVVAFVGRLNRWKGADVFVAAAASLAPAFPDVRFVVAGDAPPGEEERVVAIKRQIETSGSPGSILQLGLVPDGAAVLEAADVAVVPSTWPDPFPTVILEAMRAGCAVIASGHGGAPEMIENEVSGLLVRPGDPGALAEAIARVLRDAELRRRLGEAARERVATRFGLGRMLDELEAVYRELGG